MEWQPIETCPLGTLVLVWDYDRGMPMLVFRYVEDDGHVSYYNEHNDYIDNMDFKPKHWMSLPEAPK